MKPYDHRQHNKHAWNQLAKRGNRFATPASPADFSNPLASVDGPGWLGKSIAGKRVLCLAAGGGRQGPIYAKAGAIVTVVDISSEMLELDRQFSSQHDINLRVVETSMDDLSMFVDKSFDIVIQPVSTCYVPDVGLVYREVARVMKSGGIYVSQHKQPSSLQASIQPTDGGYLLLHESGQQTPLPEPKTKNLVRESGTLEYVHNWHSLLGELCRAGFIIEDVIEPPHADKSAAPGTFEHRSRFLPPYIRIKAVRNQVDCGAAKIIWAPE